MRKILTVGFIIITSISYSQEFNGGMLLGFTASQVDGDTYGGYDKPGVTAGAFVNRRFGDLLLWQMEICYVQRGSKKNMHPDKGDYVFYKMHLDYIEVPILAFYDYNETFAFSLGLTPGVLVNAYEENEHERFLSNPYYKFAINTIVGFNYHLSEKIELALRENYSIRPIRGYVKNVSRIFKTGQFNNSLSFSVNYHF